MIRQFTLTIVILISSIALKLFAEPHSRSIGAKDLIAFPSIRNLELNADKQIIVYELRKTDFKANSYRQNLWLKKLDGSAARQFTYSSGNEWNPKISPDGHCVAFLSDRPDQKGISGTRIWVMSISGGEAKPMTHPDRDIIEYKWSSNSDHIYYLCYEINAKQTRNWLKNREKAGFDAIDRTARKPRVELWSVNKKACKHTKLFVGDPGVSAFDVNPQGSQLVYSTNYTGDENDWVESDLFMFSIWDSSKIFQLTDFKGAEDVPVFSPDGRVIAYQRLQDHRKPFSQTEVEIIDPDSKETKRLTQKLDLHVSNFSWYSNHSLILEVNQGMNNHIYKVSDKGQTIELSGGEAYFYRSSTNPNNQAIAAVRQTATSLGEVVYSAGQGHPWEQLSNLSSDLKNVTINPQAAFYWLSRDEKFKLQGLILLPHFSGMEPLPLIVDIHGGPAGRTDIALEQFALYQAWASQGFAVFSPNYRGSEGYSAAFQVANFQDLGGGDYHDIMSGVNTLVKRGIAHPDSLVIMGGSYGGYMTNWVITQTDKFKAAVSRYGIFDLRSDFSNSIYAQWELDYLGKPFWIDPAMYRRMSPSTFIKNAHTPTLILHGADDENTFVSNSRELARALATLDVPHRFFVYPREGHGMDEPSHRLDVFERQLTWVNHHLKRGQANMGEDYMSEEIQVQIISAQHKAKFLNQPGDNYLNIKLLIDASRLYSNQSLTLADFRLEPGHLQVLGVPSGEILAPAPDLNIELGKQTTAIELDLVFPRIHAANQKLSIRGIGVYSLPR